jgi:hypothetical protein
LRVNCFEEAYIRFLEIYDRLLFFQTNCQGYFAIKDYEDMPYIEFLEFELPLLNPKIDSLIEYSKKLEAESKKRK